MDRKSGKQLTADAIRNKHRYNYLGIDTFTMSNRQVIMQFKEKKEDKKRGKR